MLPIEMEGLVIMDIETQCKAIQCSILAKPIEEKNQHKTRTGLMLWHLDQYWKLKQGVSISKKYIENTDRAPILPNYRSSWSSLTGNEIKAPKALAEIYSEPIFFNTKPDGVNNPFNVFKQNTSSLGKRFTYYDKRSSHCKTLLLYNCGWTQPAQTYS